MEIYKLTPLTSLVWFQEGPGVRNTQYTNSGVKLLNVANLIDGHIDLSTSNRYIAEEEAYGRYRHFLCDKGDLVIASSGIKVDYFDKKMGFVRQEHLPLCMNTSTIRFKVLDKNILNIRYFMYFLKSNFFKSQLSKQITGSAQLNFGPSHLKRMIVPLINIDYQNHICGILDKVYELEYKLQTELTLLNQLVKSRFIEMFGDLINKPKYPGIKLGSLGVMITGGTPSRKHDEYYGGNIPFISTPCLGSNFISEKNVQNYLTEAGVKNSATHKIPPYSLMVGNRVGVGKSSINTCEMCTNQDILSFVHIDTSRFDLLFLKKVIDQYSPYFDEHKRGATIQGVPSKVIKDSMVPDVPLEMQKRYTALVKQSDKSKMAVQKSLDELETLKKSLMQTYFG